MIKKITLSLFILISSFSLAQQGASSVYSFYGIGDMKPNQTIESRSMGGVNIQSDSIHLNFQNPASYGKLMLTTFNIGGSASFLKVSDYAAAGKATRSSFDYLAVGIPIGKIGVGLGLKPLSSVGYDIKNTSKNSTTQVHDVGTGGTNTVYLASGFKINSSLYFGVEGNYNFGVVETTRQTNESGIQYGTYRSTRSDIKGYGFNAGLTYTRKINAKNSIYASASYSPSMSFNSSNKDTLSIITSALSVIDKKPIPVNNTTLMMPSKTTIGLGYGEDKKWFVGTEITYQTSSTLTNRLDNTTNARYTNATKVAFGGYYIPNYSSFSSYLKKVTYRVGYRTENTGLVINNTAIRENGMTFGLGLPVGGGFSNINIGVEYGSRGTTKAGLVNENFFKIMIGLSLNDKWFNKTKID